MSVEIFIGLTLAVGIAGVTATVKNQRQARVLDAGQFRSKMDRMQDAAAHQCVHCGDDIEVENVRLIFGTPEGQVHVVCDKDACIFAHTQGEHAQTPMVAA